MSRFIDNLKDEMEHLPFEADDDEEEQEMNFNEMMKQRLANAFIAQPNIEKRLQDNRKSSLSLSEDLTDMALMFYDKLKGKLTMKQITQLIIESYKIIGGK